MKLNHFVSIGILAAAVLTPPVAQAAFVIGSASVTGFFQNNTTALGVPTSIVSSLSNFDVLSSALVGSANGNLAPASGPASALDFTISSVPVKIYVFDGFSFEVLDWGPVNATAFTCAPGTAQCSDGIGFSATGMVTGNGFQATAFTMSWSAQGSCNESVTTLGQCGAGATASWSSSISATGTAPTVNRVPAPGTLALSGLALLGLGLSRRKSA